MWTYVLGPLLALLPERWRRMFFADAPVNWPRAGFLSGLAEAVGCLLALAGWYLYSIQHYVDQQMDVTVAAAKGVPAEGAAFGMGAAALITFALHPLTWALAYFAIEGTFRAFAAWTSDEVAGTLPLVLADNIVTRAQRRSYERRVPVVPDIATPGGEKDPWDLRVESCRPKPTWKYPLTIRFHGSYYQVAGEAAEGGTPQRPHVYLLRRPPAGEAYRGVAEYDPDAAPPAEEKQPNFLLRTVHDAVERRRVAKLPRLPDMVQRGDGSRGWHLQVESCRPKPMWAPPRTIRFEDALYRVAETYSGSAARPFGFRLIFLPENEPRAASWTTRRRMNRRGASSDAHRADLKIGPYKYPQPRMPVPRPTRNAGRS
jgi:hypothetical protein